MKNLLNTLLLAVLILSIASCSTENFDSNIEANLSFDAQFINESTSAVNLIVYDVNGKVTENTRNVNPGESFKISELSSGETTFRIVTGGSDRIAVMETTDSNKYYVVLNEDHSVSTIQAQKI
ncbi:MAG: hypothetical protein HKN90_05575 [Flavobacteriaceae bacterium]|nr:hypothetical protein [Flavobacteriaceae bacterium]